MIRRAAFVVVVACALQALMVVAVSAAAGTQFTLFNQSLTHTATSLGTPAFSGPANWSSPTNYAGGRVYLRLQVTSKPSTKAVFSQVCMWRNNFAVETCAAGPVFTRTGTYYLDLGVLGTWYKRNGVWDYTVPPEVVMVMMKDNADRSQLLMSRHCGAFCYKGSDLASHVPIGYQASVVMVGQGHSVDIPHTWVGCPSAWGSGCPSPDGPVTPIITGDPESVTVTDGSAASFSVVATGSAPLEYQWRRNGVPIGGATGPSYTVGNAGADDNGAVFTVEVSNGGGSDLSAPAVLTVHPLGGGSSGLVSDTFSGTALGPRWLATRPAGTSVAVRAGAAVMTIPKGTHDLWTTNRNGLRITQPAADTAFEVEAVFPTLPGPRNGHQGIIVESATGAVMRFELVRGSSAQTAIRYATAASGTVLHLATSNGDGGVRIRVSRAGSTWTMKVARGSGPLIQVAVVHQPMVVSRVGVWAGNTGGNPAFSTKLDSFTVLS